MDSAVVVEVNNADNEVGETPEEDVSTPPDIAIVTNTDDDKEASLHLKPTYVLGFRSCGRTVIDFINEYVVIYPVAHHLTLYNLESRTMEFFHNVKHVKSIQSFQLSPSRELLAVAEIFQQSANCPAQITANGSITTTTMSPLTSASSTSSPPKGVNAALQSPFREQDLRALSIYKLSTRTRQRSIPLQSNSNIVSCSFSADSKFLAVLEDAPAHTVTYWKVSNAKLIASCKCPSRGSRIHVSPTNANFISVSGPTTLKYWVWTNNDFKIANFLPQLKDQEHFVDHTWLKEHMIAISERGLLLCFRITLDGCSADLTHSSRCHQPSHVRMECVTAHGKGFVLGGSAGFFSIYESSDDVKDPFPFVRFVSVGDIAFDCITVSPNSETIVASSKTRELITFSMSAIDSEQEDRIDYREFIRHGHQVGPVLQVDVCVQRPIVVSCGTDRTVRVWNFELRHYELLHHCPEEPTTVAVHPSGFQIVVAFKERVRIYQLLQESLRQVKELAIKACRFIRYAHGGHLFACASGLTVTTFRAYTFEAVHTFSGHIGAVRCLSWSRDDTYLFSAAHDGAIYRWDTSTGSRSDEMQHVVKQCQYAAFAVDRDDPGVVVAAGSDGKIREISSGEETKSFDLPHGTLITSMALMKDCKRLFAGTKTGCVLVYPWPLSNKNVAEYFAHAEGILQIRITEDNEQLITCAEDGSVSIFKILNGGLQHQEPSPEATVASKVGLSSARPISSASPERKRAGIAYTDAVLVARDDLEERRAEVVEWKQRHDQVKADVEFALHRKENEWINRLHVLKEESEHLVVQERVRYEELEARHQLSSRKHTEELTQLEAHHVKMTQELENQYERKLAQEVARYDALSETLEQTRQRCEALVEAQDSQSRGTLHAERKAAYTRAKEQNEIIKRLHEDLKYNHVKFEEVLHQEEADYEQELQKMRVEFAAQLEIERQNTAVKQGQVSAANTKLESLRKKMQELKASSHARDVLLATERSKLARLEATLANYERHFEVSRVSSHEKERAINGLKSDNRVLENFRSVLSHRIDGLETEQAPMQEHLQTLEANISEMQNELADEFRIKAETQQEMESKDAKIRTLLHEVKALRQSSLKKEYSVGEMTREFTRLAQLTTYKDLESAVKDAYKVYVMGETLHKKPPRPILTGSNSSSNLMTTAASSNVPSSPGGGGLYSPAKSNVKSNGKAANSQQKQQQSPSAATPTSVVSVVSDQALGYDCKQTVGESVKQMEYMSRTIQTLRAALDHAKTQADRVRRDSVAEGSMLIDECNRLRKENKLLQIQIRDLKRALYIAGGAAANGDSEMVATLNSARSLQRLSSPHIHSSPQLHSRPTSPSPAPHTLDLTLDVTTSGSGGPLSLAPLHTGRATPSKQQRRQRTPSSPSPSRNNSSTRALMPFAHAERGRHNVARADELAAVVEKQKRDIQRLQTQVQLLLAGAADAPLGYTVRVTPLSPAASTLSLESPRGAMAVSRIGTLRPLAATPSTASLQSSFVLAAPDFSSPGDGNSPEAGPVEP